MKTSLRIRRIRKSVEMHARFVGIKFELYSRQSTKLVVVVVVVTEKPEIHFPGPAVRAMKDLWLECSARGTPPVEITINHYGNQLVKKTGFAKVRIKYEGEYRCTAGNGAGTDSKETFVSFPTSKCNNPYAATRILSSQSPTITTKYNVYGLYSSRFRPGKTVRKIT